MGWGVKASRVYLVQGVSSLGFRGFRKVSGSWFRGL